MIRVRIGGWAASELDIQTEVACVGDEFYPLFAQWTGTALVAFDAEHAQRLADLASWFANGIDDQLEAGEVPADETRGMRGACRSLWTAAEKLRAA